jgi:hypothetical protein
MSSTASTRHEPAQAEIASHSESGRPAKRCVADPWEVGHVEWLGNRTLVAVEFPRADCIEERDPGVATHDDCLDFRRL